MKPSLYLLFALIFLAGCASPAAPIQDPNPTETVNLPIGTPTQTATVTQTITPVVSASPMCENDACLADGLQLEYLVVTRPMFREALQPFIDWKSANGYRVGLVTVDWLDATYNGRHLAEKMKTGMQDLRKQTGLRYVLLVGDTIVYPAVEWTITQSNMMSSYTLSTPFNVPTGFYRRINDDPADYVLPSDAYFVEDRDWDPDNTGVNPRPDNMVTGEGTLQADLYLGRWPARDASQVTAFFEKTKLLVPATSIFFTTDSTLADGITSFCQNWPPTEYGFMDCYQDVMKTGRNEIFETNSPWLTTDSLVVDITDFEQYTTLMENLRSNSGNVYISYHGNLDCLGVQGGNCVPAPSFIFDNIFPLMDVDACIVANFTYPDTSFMELMLLNPNGPVVVSQAPNTVLYLQGLRDGKSVGEAFWATASKWLYWPNPILLLGDPSLMVFVNPPSS